MTTTQKALRDRMAAESRLISTGVLSPQQPSLRDEERWALGIKASQQSKLTGLPAPWAYLDSQPQEADHT